MYAYNTKGWRKSTPDSAFPRTLTEQLLSLLSFFLAQLLLNVGNQWKWSVRKLYKYVVDLFITFCCYPVL